MESTTAPPLFGRVRGLDRLGIELKPGEHLDAGDHPDKGLIGKAAVGVTAPDIAMGAGEPRLLHVALGLLPLGDRPESQEQKNTGASPRRPRESRPRRYHRKLVSWKPSTASVKYLASGAKPETGRVPVRGTDRIPHGDALYGARIVKRPPRITSARQSAMVFRSAAFTVSGMQCRRTSGLTR